MASLAAWPLVLVLALSPATSEGDEAIAVLVDGHAMSAALQGVTERDTWVFDRNGQTMPIPSQELVVWGTPRERIDQPWVVLVDGSLLIARLLEIDGEDVVLASRLWAEVRVPRAMVRALLLRPPLETLARDTLMFRAVNETREEDRLLLENGDELRGRVPQTVKPEPGAFHPERIEWPLRGSAEPVTMSLAGVTAILFAQPGNQLSREAAGTCWLGFRDGSRLLVSDMRTAGQSTLLTLPAGLQLTSDTPAGIEADPWADVTFIQPVGNHVTYVSDLEALGYKHIPFLSSRWSYQKDRSVCGGALRTGDSIVLKGLGMHSSSRLAYDLDGRYQELQAELAIDQQAGVDGSVIFRVYLQDEAGSWRQAYESPIVRGGMPPVPARVDVRGAARMALIVDFADRADQGDHANWLNARLVR